MDDRPRECLYDLASDGSGHWCAARMNVANCSEEFAGADGFEEVTTGACGEAVEDGFAVVVAGEHDDLRGARGCCEKSDDLDAAVVGQMDIHKNDIRI